MVAIVRPLEEALTLLAGRDEALHRSIPRAREVVRRSKVAIRAAHAGEDVAPPVEALASAVRDLLAAVGEEDALVLSGTVEGALQEYAEAMIAISLIGGRGVPGHEDLGIDAAPYVLGAADAVGELRRAMLDAIGGGDIDAAGRHFGAMRELYDLLSSCVVGNETAPLRRKVDVARGLVERSHGDLTGALVACRWAAGQRDGRTPPEEG